jgi:hypothetical protein
MRLDFGFAPIRWAVFSLVVETRSCRPDPYGGLRDAILHGEVLALDPTETDRKNGYG